MLFSSENLPCLKISKIIISNNIHLLVCHSWSKSHVKAQWSYHVFFFILWLTSKFNWVLVDDCNKEFFVQWLGKTLHCFDELTLPIYFLLQLFTCHLILQTLFLTRYWHPYVQWLGKTLYCVDKLTHPIYFILQLFTRHLILQTLFLTRYWHPYDFKEKESTQKGGRGASSVGKGLYYAWYR